MQRPCAAGQCGSDYNFEVCEARRWPVQHRGIQIRVTESGMAGLQLCSSRLDKENHARHHVTHQRRNNTVLNMVRGRESDRKKATCGSRALDRTEQCEKLTKVSLDSDHHSPPRTTMANVVHPHPQIDFHHSSSLGHPPQIGLGLSLSMSSSLVGFSHSHSNVVQPPPSINPSRALKRRFEQDDEQADQSYSNGSGARDVAMERSPTPERPKRAPPKRARNSSTFAQEPKGGRMPKEHPNSSVENQDVDVGVLLG